MRLFVIVTLLLFAPTLSLAQDDGEALYNANCAACHQMTGEGIPAAFPPLAGHLPTLFMAEGGRDYLVQQMLYGLQGEIEVNGQIYNGLMPGLPHLSNEELAAMLNYALFAWGHDQLLPEDVELFSAEELAAARTEVLTPQEVYQLRIMLELTD